MLESLQTFALCALVFIVLPELDLVRSLLLLSATSTVPSLCKVIFGRPPTDDSLREEYRANSEDNHAPAHQISPKKSFLSPAGWRRLWYIGNCCAALIQLSAVAALSVGGFGTDTNQAILVEISNTTGEVSLPRSGRIYRLLPSPWMIKRWWVIPLALVFVSLNWWENFVEKNIQVCGCIRIPLKSFKVRLHALKQKGSIITSIWNTGIIVAFPYIVFSDFMYKINIENQNKRAQSDIFIEFSAPLAQGLSSLLAHLAGSLACKLCMQEIGYSLPLLLSTPLTVIGIVLQCHYGYIPYVIGQFWHCPEGFGVTSMDSITYWQYTLCIIWWFSQMILAGHIWKPRQNNMDRTEK